MAKNPFKKEADPQVEAPEEAPEVAREDAIEATLNAIEAAEKAEGDTKDESKVAPPADETVVEESSELFDEADEEIAAEGEAEDEEDSLFDDPEKPRELPKTVPYARLRKVIGERNAERETNTGLRTALEASKSLADVFHAKYKGFENPAAIATFDANFMASLQEMAKTNRDVAILAESVKDFMKTGRLPVTEQNQPAPIVPPATVVEPDKRIDKMIENTARATIKETLADLNVRPAFQKLIADSLLQQDGVAAEELTPTSIKALAKQFIKENGLTAADVLVKAPKKVPGEKPKTAGQAGPVTDEPETKVEGDPSTPVKTPPAPKTREEWESTRNERLRKLIS